MLGIDRDNRMKGRHWLRDESGQTMSEYAVILLFLIPAAVLVFTGLGDAVINPITSLAKLLP